MSDACPVCFNAFDRRERAVIHPFDCASGSPHGVCRECDRALFQRHDDRCPLCRAPRKLAVAARHHGARAPGIPVHLQPAPPPEMASPRMFFPADDAGFLHGPNVSVYNAPDGADSADSADELDDRLGEWRGISVRELLDMGRTVRHAVRLHVDGAVSPIRPRRWSSTRPPIPDPVDGAADAFEASERLTSALRRDARTMEALRGLLEIPNAPLGRFRERVLGQVGQALSEDAAGDRGAGRRARGARLRV